MVRSTRPWIAPSRSFRPGTLCGPWLRNHYRAAYGCRRAASSLMHLNAPSQPWQHAAPPGWRAPSLRCQAIQTANGNHRAWRIPLAKHGRVVYASRSPRGRYSNTLTDVERAPADSTTWLEQARWSKSRCAAMPESSDPFKWGKIRLPAAILVARSMIDENKQGGHLAAQLKSGSPAALAVSRRGTARRDAPLISGPRGFLLAVRRKSADLELARRAMPRP